MELCEGHCTGIPTIQEELERNGSPVATFETDADRQSVCVTIPVHPRFLEKEADKHIGIEKEKTDIEQKKTGIETGIEIKLTDTEKSIIEVMMKTPQITITDIAASIGMSRSGVQYAIDNLKKKNVLKREGSTKKGTWVVVDVIREQIYG